MEYGATIWNPYLKGDIDKLERIQNRAIRFVKKDYKSRETGAITRMREDLELETLEERRLSLRLILMYKVVEGLVPALPTDNCVKLARPKRDIKAKHFKDHITSNIVEKRTCNNTKGLQETAVPTFFLCGHCNSLEPSAKQCRACKFLRSI
jgi:hypothetical protein